MLQSLAFANKWPAAREKSRTISPTDLVYVPSNDAYALGAGGRLQEDSARAIEIEYTFSDGSVLLLRIRKGRITNLLIEPSDVELARRITSIENPLSIFSPGLAGVARNENHVSDGVLLRVLARGDSNIILRNILIRLKEHGNYIRFLRDLSEIFPDVGIVYSYNPAIDEFIDVYIQRGADVVPLDLVGTGLLQTLQILSYFYLYSPKLILLDEPDSHLHPNNQRLLCSLLSKLTEEQDVQAIITTHSRHVLDALYGDANVIWMQSGRAQVAGADSHVEILMDIGALDIKERLRQDDYDVVVLTEDKRKGLFVNILDSNGFDIARTLILSYGGVASTHVLKSVVQVVRQVSDKKIVAHRDRDYLLDDEVVEWKARAVELGCEPFVTDGHDIEAYYTSKAYLVDVWPDAKAGQVDIDLVLNTAIEELVPESIGDYVNGRIEIEKRKGNAGGLDAGRISVEAARKSQASPLSIIKGKKLLGRLRKIAQEHYGFALPVATSTSLVDPQLKSVLNRLPK